MQRARLFCYCYWYWYGIGIVVVVIAVVIVVIAVVIVSAIVIIVVYVPIIAVVVIAAVPGSNHRLHPPLRFGSRHNFIKLKVLLLGCLVICPTMLLVLLVLAK